MIPIHSISLLPGSISAQNNQFIFGRFKIPNVIGGAPDAAVATVVNTIGELPPDYTVLPVPASDTHAWISAKTAGGFTLNLRPLVSGVTLPVGSTDVIIFG